MTENVSTQQCLIPYLDVRKEGSAAAKALAGLPYVRNIFKLLGHAEGLFPSVTGVFTSIFDHDKRALPLLDWQLIALRIAAVQDDEYEWEANICVAEAKGMDDGKLKAIRDSLSEVQKNEAGVWTSRDLAILRLVDEQLATHSNSKDTVDELRKTMSTQEVMECYIILGMYTLVSSICKGLRIDLDGEMPGLDKTIANIR